MSARHRHSVAPDSSRRLGGRALFGVLVLLCLVCGPPATADNLPVEAFFGRYEGQSISKNDEGLSARDLAVTIERKDRHRFTVAWTTITRKPGGAERRKAYSIEFEPTQRPDVYRSAMRTNLFGDRVPMNPFTGDPLVWARVMGRTFTVYALIILSDGSFDMQVYDRTLTDSGLKLRFSRYVEGEPVRVVEGTLVRIGK